MHNSPAFSRTTSFFLLLCLQRVELDAVGFKIVALASMKDLLAVCGLNQCLILRINKDGDISERQTVEFANSFPSYVIPKVCF